MNHERANYLRAKAESYAQDLRDTDLEPWESLDTHILEVTVFVATNNSDTYIVELTLELGGPTTRVVIDSRWGVTIESSDGPDPSASYSYESVDVQGSARSTFEELAEMLVEVHA